MKSTRNCSNDALQTRHVEKIRFFRSRMRLGIAFGRLGTPVQGQLCVQRRSKPPVQGQLDVQRRPKLPVRGQLGCQLCPKLPVQGQLDVQGHPKRRSRANLTFKGATNRRSRASCTVSFLIKRRSRANLEINSAIAMKEAIALAKTTERSRQQNNPKLLPMQSNDQCNKTIVRRWISTGEH